MFFYLKKFLIFFLEPLTIVFIFFIIGFYFLFKKDKSLNKGKIFLVIGALLLALFSSPSFSYLLIKPLENKFPPHKDFDPNARFEYILVLGSGHSTNETLPPNSRMGQQGLSRVIEGVRLSQLYPNTKLIFSGYGGTAKESFAEMAKNVAIQIGFPEEKILLSPDAKDTFEESQKSLELIGKKPFLMVSSASHLPRAMGIFTKLGMNPTPAPTDYYETGNWQLKLPSSNGLYQTERGIYEWVGIFWAWITGRY